MFFKESQYKIEPKSKFHLRIQEYYCVVSKGKIPVEILDELISEIVHDQYNYYKECWKKYPKSKRRYSIFKLEDLEHPYIYFFIINFFKTYNLLSNKFQEYCKVLFKMNNEEFQKTLEYTDWYDNK